MAKISAVIRRKKTKVRLNFLTENPDCNFFFSISCSFNKVFETTERNKYCSDQCYRRSCFVQGQLDTSPLWIRDPTTNENEIELLWDSIGLPGDELQFEISGKLFKFKK